MIVLDELLILLRENAALSEKLRVTNEDDKIYPLRTTDIEGNSLVYNYTSLISDGIIEQGRLTLKAISKDIFTSMEIMEAAKSSLLTFADETKTKHITKIVQSGGAEPQYTEIGSFVTIGFFSVTNISYQF